MKKVLLLTNIYPTKDPNYGGTKVCHFFSTEWVKMGYDVQVIHFDSVFPCAYTAVGRMFKSVIQAKTGCVVNVSAPRKPEEYKIDNVNVLFVPLKKYIPHSIPSKSVLEQAYMYIINFLKARNFQPDVISAHFTLPQLYYIYRFKLDFPNLKTALVLHDGGQYLKATYKEKCSKYMEAVDVWGFRSEAFRRQFAEIFGVPQRSFLCYSGIPSDYIELDSKHFENKISKFVFLGSLYNLKNVDVSLRALNKVFPNKDFSFDIVGAGAEFGNLKKLANELAISEQVKFHGRLKRDESQKILKEAEVFVMVSQHEAFGLVYLEAMAKGCITIATKGQGFDGIIINGVNGFLCEQNNIEALSEVIEKIINMKTEDLNDISRKALETARIMTNEKVALDYITSIS